MTLIKDAGKLQVTCDECPLTYRRTYDEADFQILVEDIKTEGWRIKREAAAWKHTCADCSKRSEKRLL